MKGREYMIKGILGTLLCLSLIVVIIVILIVLFSPVTDEVEHEYKKD